MDVRLVIENGKKQGQVYRVKSDETVIGRKRDCDLTIPSPEVSRRHCLLSIHKGSVSVEDLESVNGTYVNGHRITAKMVLRPGDRLEVGPSRFVVEYEISKEALDRLSADESAIMAEAVEEPQPPASGKRGPNPFAFAHDQPVDALPVDDEPETELVAPPEDDEPIPFAEESEIDESLNLPPSAQLRDILSEMGKQPPPPGTKGRKEKPKS
jgi:pSer/pThr/pTyr-binding forkhead associated (FHA) protein